MSFPIAGRHTLLINQRYIIVMREEKIVRAKAAGDANEAKSRPRRAN